MRHNIPIYKSLKFKIILVVTIAFLVIIGFLLQKSNQNQQEMIRANEENLNQIAVDTIDRRFKVSYQILETGLAQIISSPLVVEALVSGDENKLSSLVEKSYEKLQAVGVNEFHFFLPNGTSFLNLYEYKNDKDDVLCDRAIVSDINSDMDHLPIKGIEECQHGLFLRYIAPIYNNEKFIGSVELGMEVESRILNIFKNVSGGEWYLYSLNGKNQSLMQATVENDSYPLDINKEIATSLYNGEVYTTEKSPYIIQMIPIANYKGQYNHYLKRIFDNSELINLQSQYTRGYIIYGILAAIFATILLWIIMTHFLKPLIYLEQKVRNFESGAMDEAIEVRSNDEIGYLAGAMEKMRKSLYKRESDLKKQSYIDPLTGVYNRLYYEHKLDQIIEEGLFPTALIMADIDGLKQINDKEGHVAGDAYIIKCAETMKSSMRGTDKLFRIGGDEFILLFPNTDQATGEYILERVRNEIQNYNKNLKKDEIPLSVSFGLGVCENTHDCMDHALASADKKMYEDKANKKRNLTNLGTP